MGKGRPARKADNLTAICEHNIKTDETRVATRLPEAESEGRREAGRTSLRWLEDVENDLYKRWRQKVNKERAYVVKGTKLLREPHRQ
jgi:urease accessory protein UreF